MSRDSTAVMQTWAKAAGRLANHKRDYVIEVMRTMESAKGVTRSAEGKVKAKKKSAATTHK